MSVRMTGALALAAALFWGLARVPEASAQGVMPGGWDLQFGAQSFSGAGMPGFGGGFSMSSHYGYGGMSPFGPSGYGWGQPFASGVLPAGPNPSGMLFNPTTNAVDPLIHSIRQSTRKRRGR